MIDYSKIEKKWQLKWEKSNLFEINENSKQKKLYVLEMYSYPSGSGLHMGHASNYIIGDVYARYKKMCGFNVLHPVGYDSFGLPAENAAIKEKFHPKLFTENSIKNFIKQQKALGLSYDWSRLIYSHDPNYYKWNQWLFLQMYNKKLAYKKESPVNWCSQCNTVLANEQVINGKCWRHENTNVELKVLDQWFFKITDYSKELLNGINKLDWPEDVKQIQKNWIGGSEGTLIDFKIKDSDKKIQIFTTRIDTIYGVTALLLAPEHPKVLELSNHTSKEKEVKNFIKKILLKEKRIRTSDLIEKEGVFLNKYAIHPLTYKEIPIYVANYVLPEYGGGAVMAVPAHDQRDFEFAKKYKLKIKQVISPTNNVEDKLDNAYTKDGILVNSEKYSGLSNKKALIELNKFLLKNKLGKKITQYKLRDWLISRQRYWGTPIPIIYCKSCGIVPVPEKDLPVKLPEDVRFTLGGNPLETSKSFVNTKCPKCNNDAKRETDTMDTFIDSSWYYLRFLDPQNDSKMFSKSLANFWMPIDFYVGGKEHATGHLVYFRFITKVLRDLDLINFDEPSIRLFNQGMLHKNGVVMSKSKGNVVSQEEITEKYGVDTARLFLLSISSPEKDKEWSEKGIEGSFKTINKILPLADKKFIKQPTEELDNILHKTIKNVTESIENIQYNLSTIYLTELINYLYLNDATKESLEILAKLISPFTPHIAEELWMKLKNKSLIYVEKWPLYDNSKINPEIDAKIEFINNIINDSKRIIDLIKITPKKITISVAEGWKYEFISKLKKELKLTRDASTIIKKLYDTAHSKEISKLVANLVYNEHKLPLYILSKAQELKILEKNKEFIEKELKAEIIITKDDIKAMPFKPSIRIK